MWDSSKYNRMSPPRNAEPWGVALAGTVYETYCTRERAIERAEELAAKWDRDYYVVRKRA